jgi:hypothetical protein
VLNRSLKKNFHRLLIAALVMVLAVSLAPMRTASAATLTSDLSIQLVSAPRTAKSCQVFQASFRITNLGPDAASGLFVSIPVPDQLGTLSLSGVPDTLAAGQSVTVTATVKVVAFGPGDSRSAWVGAGVSADPFPDTSLDPNWENNNVSRSLKLVGKPKGVCP